MAERKPGRRGSSAKSGRSTKRASKKSAKKTTQRTTKAATKKTSAKAASKSAPGRKASGPPKPSGLDIFRGGERFTLAKADSLFAVKKRPRAARGSLAAAAEDPQAIPGLEFQPAESQRDIEVYRVAEGSLDKAMKVLRAQSPDIDWCAHVYHMPGDPKGLMIPLDSIYVEFKPDADPKAINRLLATHKLELMPAEGDNPNAFLLKLTSESTANPIKIANALAALGHVELAEPDFAMKMQLFLHIPTDPRFRDQWHLENRGGFGLTAGADVAAPAAWDLTRGDRSVVVAVMDDGVQISHPDFSSPGKIVAPRDFGQNDFDPSPAAIDDNHGTACAGVAVADENGIGVVGLAPNCALMPIRTSGMISNQTIQALFDYATTSGADVISCSWGVAADFFTLSTPMIESIRRAAQNGRNGRGCVVLFAAGNEDRPVDGFDGATRVRSGFAIHPDVIAVAASNSNDVRSHYSNFGAQIWVCAPSSGSGGRRIVTTDRTGSAGYQTGDYTTVNGFGGTSSSTPLVAGLCGLILSVNPDLTSGEVREILRDTARKIDPGSGNYDVNGHSDLYGFGRVDAFLAVQEAQRRLTPSVARQVVFESSPALPIPDREPAGVSDTIDVREAATVRSVGVMVDIEHTYQGDLQVVLQGPDGTRATLHDRQGGTRNDLVATYTVAGTPSLAGFVGGAAFGPWSIQVADLASFDVGSLRRWQLILGLEGGPRTEWETAPGLAIPDNDTAGIVSELDVDGSGPLREIELTVDINHTFRGDLQVTLESPGGVSATVHRLTGGANDNLQQTYTAATTPALGAMAGVEIHGRWKLKVADLQPVDLGKLNSWKLKLVT